MDPVTIELTVAPVKSPTDYRLDHYAVGDGVTYREFPPSKFREAVAYWTEIGVSKPLEAWAKRGPRMWQWCKVVRATGEAGPLARWTPWEVV